MDFDEPLDFESEDRIVEPALPTKKRKKVIGLDDLLTDYYKDKSKLIDKGSKRPTSKKSYNSDDEEEATHDTNEAKLANLVYECEKQVQGIKAEEEIPLWGVQVFGDQRSLPPIVCNIGSCSLLKSFMNNALNEVFELNLESGGENLVQGFLINGWLLRLVFRSRHVEESIASWLFNLMLYSLNEDLSESACDFWCCILNSKNEVGQPPLKIDWLPTYAEIKQALAIYGYLLDSSIQISPTSEMVHEDYDSQGPPQNIRWWVRFVAACCEARITRSIFSIVEAEELLSVIICLFLDRQLQGLSLLFNECMVSIINFFTDNEWSISCEKVAKSLACRVKRDLNCLRLVECISGVDTRSKHLRSEVALQILLSCSGEKVLDGEEILRLMIAINVKDKSCDFFSMYIYLVLTENWLFFRPPLDVKPFVHEMWGIYLRNCSVQISSTDMRSYASKVRNKASYLLQTIFHKNNSD